MTNFVDKNGMKPDTTPIKEKFKQMMYNGTELTNKGTQVFNAIWGNGGLREKLFPSIIDKKKGQDKFEEIIEDLKSPFYNFIFVR